MLSTKLYRESSLYFFRRNFAQNLKLKFNSFEKEVKKPKFNSLEMDVKKCKNSLFGLECTEKSSKFCNAWKKEFNEFPLIRYPLPKKNIQVELNSVKTFKELKNIYNHSEFYNSKIHQKHIDELDNQLTTYLNNTFKGINMNDDNHIIKIDEGEEFMMKTQILQEIDMKFDKTINKILINNPDSKMKFYINEKTNINPKLVRFGLNIIPDILKKTNVWLRVIKIDEQNIFVKSIEPEISKFRFLLYNNQISIQIFIIK